MTELRAALRGRTLMDLASSASVAVEEAEQAVSLLVARGQAVKRGAKYFAA